MVVARTGLSLAIGLDQETAEVGNELVDLLRLALPPTGYRGVERVGRRGLAECHGCGEVDAQEDADAIGAQQVGYLAHLLQIGRGQHLGRGVDVVEHGTVDADGGVGAGVILD